MKEDTALFGPFGKFSLKPISVKRDQIHYRWSKDSNIIRGKRTFESPRHDEDNLGMRWVLLATMMMNGYEVTRQFYIKNGVSRKKIDSYLKSFVARRAIIEREVDGIKLYKINPPVAAAISGDVEIYPSNLFNKEQTAIGRMKFLALRDRNGLNPTTAFTQVPKKTFWRFAKQLAPHITAKQVANTISVSINKITFWIHKDYEIKARKKSDKIISEPIVQCRSAPDLSSVNDVSDTATISEVRPTLDPGADRHRKSGADRHWTRGRTDTFGSEVLVVSSGSEEFVKTALRTDPSHSIEEDLSWLLKMPSNQKESIRNRLLEWKKKGRIS